MKTAIVTGSGSGIGRAAAMRLAGDGYRVMVNDIVLDQAESVAALIRSDGGEAIAGMAQASMELGHTCLGITDHSYGLPIARGISMTDAMAQHREIDTLNAKLAGRFRVFKGIEANIRSKSLGVSSVNRA